MLFYKAVASATRISCALAQARLAFESVPAVAVTGETYTVSWGGGDGSAVTSTLRKGDPDDLTTVGILGEGITRDFFEWEVSDELTPDEYVFFLGQEHNNQLTWQSVTTLCKSHKAKMPSTT